MEAKGRYGKEIFIVSGCNIGWQRSDCCVIGALIVIPCICEAIHLCERLSEVDEAILHQTSKFPQVPIVLSSGSLYFHPRLKSVVWDSSVGIALRYGLDGPGIESTWGRDFQHPSRPTVRPTHPPVQWVPGLFPGGKATGAWR
jgi:hypothetical protein